MHMADALISPAVGGALWVASGSIVAFCARKINQTMSGSLIPMMGVLGAFVFAAQMINFSIPGTGSSGHLGGGLLLAILLGPYAAMLVIASVLTVQAFFFADGGLLALGCNIFNLGFFPAFIAYPLIYKPIAGNKFSTSRGWTAAIAAAVAGLLMGASSVVSQTMLSGISDLSWQTFSIMMISIHFAIGVVEGLATATVVAFVARSRPDVLPTASIKSDFGKPAIIGLAVAALIIGGTLSWFASAHPDGLEWSLEKASGTAEIPPFGHSLHENLSNMQSTTAILPDYNFRNAQTESANNLGTSTAGVLGGAITLLLAGLIGWALTSRAPKRAPV
jgi:cobalt/nickel transport system permease protein